MSKYIILGVIAGVNILSGWWVLELVGVGIIIYIVMMNYRHERN